MATEASISLLRPAAARGRTSFKPQPRNLQLPFQPLSADAFASGHIRTEAASAQGIFGWTLSNRGTERLASWYDADGRAWLVLVSSNDPAHVARGAPTPVMAMNSGHPEGSGAHLAPMNGCSFAF